MSFEWRARRGTLAARVAQLLSRSEAT